MMIIFTDDQDFIRDCDSEAFREWPKPPCPTLRANQLDRIEVDRSESACDRRSFSSEDFLEEIQSVLASAGFSD